MNQNSSGNSRSIFNCGKALLVFCFLGSLPLRAQQITYVDASAVNTKTINDSAFSTSASNYTDSLWSIRTSGITTADAVNGAIFEAGALGAGENVPVIITTISGLAPGATYNVYAYEITTPTTDTGETWRMQAGLAPDLLGYFDRTTAGTTVLPAGSTTSLVDPSGNVVTIPTNRNFRQCPLGSAVADGSGNLAVYIDAAAGTSSSNNRTWYDGVGYTLSGTAPSPNYTITVDPATPITAGTANFATEWNTNGNFENWSVTNATAVVANGILSGTATSGDPNLRLTSLANGPDLALGWNDFVELRFQAPVGYSGNVKIYYGTTSYAVTGTAGNTFTSVNSGFSGARVVTIPSSSIARDGAFHTYRLDLGLEPPWRDTLTDLRIDFTGGTVASGTPFAVDYIRIGDDPNAIVYQPRYTTECPAAGGVTPSGALLGPGDAAYSMESKHFRFLWNDAVAANASWTSNMAHGTLRNLEETWQVHAKKLGYLDPSLAWGATTGTRYKLNVTSWYSGYWAGGDTDTSGNTLSRLNITPDGLRVDPPTWVIPHELMHCFQFYNNGISNSNKTAYMPGEWFEFHANYGRERWLETYSNLFPNQSGIDPSGIRCEHQIIGSGRDYYLCWPMLLYIDQNPDNLPGLGEGTVAKVWRQTQSGEYPLMTLAAIASPTSLKDITGYYARRQTTFNYASQSAIQSSLSGFGEPLDYPATQRWQYTDLVQRSDDPTWWRIPFEMAPMQGCCAISELAVSGSGTPGRVVTVNFHGLPDSARGADWRASLIVLSDNGSERYSSLWSSGTNSVTLAANENKLYLSVAGTPDVYYSMGWDEPTFPYRSHPSKSRFPFEIQVTGAAPRQRDNGSATGLVQVANGGGYRASTATVASTAYVGPNARVLGTAAVTGSARILDYAVVSDSAQVSGSAVVSGHAWVRSNALVTGNAKLRDWALVEGGTVTGFARVLEHGNIKGGVVQDIATAKGSSGSPFGTLSGNAVIDGDYGDFFTGRDVANSIAFGFLPYNGIPDSYLRTLPAGLYASYTFDGPHDSRILDQYGVTDGFTINSPAWVAADAVRKGFLQFDGTSQAVSLDRSICDLHNFSFTAFVKPLGGACDQALLWLGANATQRLYLTPDDGTGHLKFAIANGGADQTISAPALPIGIWSHVAVTLDGVTGTLYINGTNAVSAPISILPDQLLAPNTATGLQQNYLARSGGNVMPMFNGAVDNVQFYGFAQAASDIAALQPVTSPVTSGTLYVDLRATDSSAGSATWINRGTIGNFTATASPQLVSNVAGTNIPGVSFDGSTQAYTSTGVTNSDIDGNGTRTIEVWAYNPSLTSEESMVSWGYRGTTNSDMSFNWGSSSPWDSATHWGDDVAWSSIPGTGAWHYLVYTYDGSLTATVYVDGAVSTAATLSGTLSTFASQPINIACQRDSAGGARDKFFGGYINSVRVHGGVLTASQILANYQFGPYRAANSPPALNAIADRYVNYDSASIQVPVTISDADTPVAALTLSGSSGNPTLVSGSAITFSGTGSSRTATISLTPGLTGTARITFTAGDGASTASQAFNVLLLNQAQTWRLRNFGTITNAGLAADLADPYNSGISNLLERAFGGNPNKPSQAVLPYVDPGGTLLSLDYFKSDAATDLTCFVQSTTSLSSTSWVTASGTSTILSDNGTVQWIRFTTAPGNAGRKFLRLQVTSPQ